MITYCQAIERCKRVIHSCHSKQQFYNAIRYIDLMSIKINRWELYMDLWNIISEKRVQLQA